MTTIRDSQTRRPLQTGRGFCRVCGAEMRVCDTRSGRMCCLVDLIVKGVLVLSSGEKTGKQ